MAGRPLLAGIAGVAVLLALGAPDIGAAASVASDEARSAAGTQATPVPLGNQARRRTGPAQRRNVDRRRPTRRKRCRTGRRHRGSKRRTLERRRAIRRRTLRRRAGRRRPCRRARRAPRQIKAPAAPTLPSEPPPAWLPALPPPAATPPPSAPVAPGACAGSDSVPSAANIATVRTATLCLVNAQRSSAGLLPLVDQGQLAAAAQGHADDMAARGYFSHTSADGRTFDQRIRNAGYTGGGMAENIAWGRWYLGTPRRIVGAWMNSPGHRANILSGALSESGIGVAPRTPTGAAGGTYVYDFGAP